jgi:hypothetical protein
MQIPLPQREVEKRGGDPSNYPGTQKLYNSKMVKAIDRSAIQVDVVHYKVSLRY